MTDEGEAEAGELPGASDAQGAQDRCATHPERPAELTCPRCGSFACKACSVDVDVGRWACAQCAKLPEVDYLNAMKRALWGKRDGWVWFIGVVWTLSSGVQIWWTVRALTLQPSSWLVVDLVLDGVSAAITVAYLLLSRWSRLALFALPVILVLRALVLGAGADFRLLASIVVTLLFVIVAHGSPRNRLAFKLDVGRRDLRRLYETQSAVTNKISGQALALSIFSFLVPGLSIVAIAMAIAGLRRVDRTAWPPIGGRSNCVAAIVLSIFGLASSSLVAYAVLVA